MNKEEFARVSRLRWRVFAAEVGTDRVAVTKWFQSPWTAEAIRDELLDQGWLAVVETGGEEVNR